ncbi:MAG: hypothetical protein IJT18_06260 [Oscillospiraceae bacterium]|nr:hypothetical protein [Oscillospiraceae bacterium]
MMKKYTKLLALLLAAVMVFTMLPLALADEAQMEGVTQTGEETPSVSLALDSSLGEGAKDELAALETAEKDEPIVGAMSSTVDEADAVWSYTPVSGNATYYYDQLSDAYKYGLVPDSAAGMQTAGTLKLLKDWTIDNTVGSVVGSTSTGAATAGSAATVALIDYPGKKLNIDFNGHTIQINTPSDSDDRATLVRLGRGNLDMDYSVHIFSSAKDGSGNTIRGTFSKNKNKSTMRGIVMDYGGGSGQRNVVIEDMNVTTIKNEPVVNLMGTENNLTIRNSTITSATTSYGAVTIDTPTCTTTTKVTANVTLENSTLNGGLAGLMLLSCKKNVRTNYTTDFSSSLTFIGTNVVNCNSATVGAQHHGILIAEHCDGTAASMSDIVYDTEPEDVSVTSAGGAPEFTDEIIDTKCITTVREEIPAAVIMGDVNDDGEVNERDVLALRRWIVGGYGVTINEETADVSHDDIVNGIDITVLRRYFAGGYGVSLDDPNEYKLFKLDLTDDTQYKTYGRAYMVEHGVNLLWPDDGIEFTAMCEGSVELSYLAGENVYFRSFVDGVEVARPVATSAGTSVTVATGLSRGEHTIRLVRDTDISKSNLQFVLRAVNLTGVQSSVTKPANKSLLIEYVGDSITAGKYTLPDLGEPGQHAATLSYAYLTSQALDADWVVTARGGIGLCRTTTNGGGSCPKTMAQCYDYVNPFAADANLIEYGFERKADVVIMALGTNDSTSKIPEDEFLEATRTIIDMIRARNGSDVKIVVLANMMSSSRNAHLQSVATEKGTYYLKVTLDNSGGNNHPSVSGHETIARELTAYLRTIL